MPMGLAAEDHDRKHQQAGHFRDRLAAKDVRGGHDERAGPGSCEGKKKVTRDRMALENRCTLTGQ